METEKVALCCMEQSIEEPLQEEFEAEVSVLDSDSVEVGVLHEEQFTFLFWQHGIGSLLVLKVKQGVVHDWH